MQVLRDQLRGTLIPILVDHLDLRSPLVGSPFHLIHHFLNHPYPPKAYKTWLIPHGREVEKLCCCTEVLAKSSVNIEGASWSF